MGVEGERLTKLTILGEAVIDVTYRAGIKDADAELMLRGLLKLLEEATQVMRGADNQQKALSTVMSDDQLAKMAVKGLPC